MKRRILVVEDNAPNRELLCDWLEAQGHEALCADDLGSAFRVLAGQPPDVVLLDVQLGNEDGLSLAASMRRQPELSGIPVIAVTAHALVTDQERFLQAGCNACISKPVDFKLLDKQLKQWLRPERN